MSPCTPLKKTVQHFHQPSSRVYLLHFFFGASITNNLALTPDALLAYTDALMYASKKQHS